MANKVLEKEKIVCYNDYNRVRYTFYMNMIERTVFEQTKESLFNPNRKVVLLFGTRRTGKTTILENLINHCEKKKLVCKYLNCDILRFKQMLDTTDDQRLAELVNGIDVLAIDEAQNIENIGKTLKIIYDTFPHVRVIATGSSSFDLANKTGEPLVGRMRSYTLYSFSMEELRKSIGIHDVNYNIQKYLRYGLYPSIYGLNENEAIQELETLISGYLYKDLLTFNGIRNSDKILTLLQCLALQVGSEVSFSELGNKLQLDTTTVKSYIELLEKCYIIFKLPALARNMQNEIAGNRTRKIYFYDVGIRNALIEDFRDINLRNDIGGVWENFCIVELKKKAQREGRRPLCYFWRTTDHKEIDYLEEENGEFNVYEFKLSDNRRVSLPKGFDEHYKVKSFNVITKDNWHRYF